MMEERRNFREAVSETHAGDARVLRWLAALEPLLGRSGPLTASEAERWRRRLPALIASGEILRYQCVSKGQASTRAAALNLLDRALDEARSLRAELSPRVLGAEASQARYPIANPGVEPTSKALERAQALVCHSAARREIEELVRDTGDTGRLPATLTLVVPPGRASGLEGFNLCFFAFLCFQTLLWGSGLVHGAELSSVVLYALILAPFWWWGGYLLQALALALSPEQLSLSDRRVRLRRAWFGATELELPGDGSEPIRRECWFEINLRPVHCLMLYGADGRRARFAVARDPAEHERLVRQIEEHLRGCPAQRDARRGREHLLKEIEAQVRRY